MGKTCVLRVKNQENEITIKNIIVFHSREKACSGIADGSVISKNLA